MFRVTAAVKKKKKKTPAVFHPRKLQYSVIATILPKAFGNNISQNYILCSRFIMARKFDRRNFTLSFMSFVVSASSQTYLDDI